MMMDFEGVACTSGLLMTGSGRSVFELHVQYTTSNKNNHVVWTDCGGRMKVYSY